MRNLIIKGVKAAQGSIGTIVGRLPKNTIIQFTTKGDDIHITLYKNTKSYNGRNISQKTFKPNDIDGIIRFAKNYILSKTQDSGSRVFDRLFRVLDNKPLRTRYKISYDAYYTAGIKLKNGEYSRSETEKRVSEVIATSKQEALQKLKNSLNKAERAGYRYSNFKIIKIEREPVYEKLSEKEKLKLLLGDEAKTGDSEKQFIPPLTKFKEILKNATGDNKKFKWIINSNATGYFTTKGDMISFIAKSNNKGGAGWATGKATELEKIYTRFKTQILPYN